MDVMQLKITTIYFLAVFEIILVIMFGLIIACKPYTTYTSTQFEVEYKYKSYATGVVVVFIVFGTALMHLLDLRLVGVFEG